MNSLRFHYLYSFLFLLVLYDLGDYCFNELIWEHGFLLEFVIRGLFFFFSDLNSEF